MTRGHRGSLLLRCRALASPSPCRFIPAHPTFHVTAADWARVACMPGTAWPVSGYPPGLSWSLLPTPVSMPSNEVSTRQQRRACARLPSPRLTHSPCAFSSSLTTPGIQPDAARGGLKPPPRRATPEGQQSPICHTAPQQARSPTSSTFLPALVAQTRSSPEPNYVSGWGIT